MKKRKVRKLPKQVPMNLFKVLALRPNLSVKFGFILSTYLAILLSIIITIPVLAGPAYSQDKTPTFDRTADPVLLLKVFNPDGWDIPQTGPNESFQSKLIYYFQDVPVTEKSYLLQKTFDLEVDFYSLDSDNILTKTSKLIEVKSVGVYSVGEKTFAYSLVGSPFGFAPGGDRAAIGLIYRVFYFDEDGDGTFETRYTTSHMPKHVPEWARQPID